MERAILIIFIIVLCLSAVYMHLKVQEKNPTRKEIAECKAKDEIEEAFCFSELAVEKENYVICKEINESSLRDNCFVLVASAVGDKIICNRIKSRKTLETCLRLVVEKNKAVREKNIENSEQISNELEDINIGGDTDDTEKTERDYEPSSAISGQVGDCIWECTSWSVCSNGIQLRDCEYLGTCNKDEAQQVRSC